MMSKTWTSPYFIGPLTLIWPLAIRHSPPDLVHHRGQRLVDIDAHMPFILRRGLQGSELVVQNGGGHEMTWPPRQPRRNQLRAAHQMDEQNRPAYPLA